MGDKKHKFKGFTIPKSNYFCLPNNWTDITHDMTSMSEHRIVEYVLRHTWGYNGQECESKRITTEEFVNGRKKKNGGRVDMGTGLSPESVRLGLKKAIEHGFLEVEEDKRDLARIKRKYRLVMENRSLEPKFRPLEPKFRPLESRGLERGSRDRTWKDNSRNPIEKTNSNSLSEAQASDDMTTIQTSSDEEKDPPLRKKRQPTEFDYRATDELMKVVSSYRKVQSNSKRRDWANQFRQMRETDGVPRKDIVETIKWYAKHIGEEWMPEAYSARAFRQKYDDGKFMAAMKRTSSGAVSSNGKKITRDNMYESENCVNGVPKIEVGRDGRQYDGQLLERIRKECGRRFGRGLPMKENLNAILMESGEKAGSIPVEVIGRVW